MTKATKVDIIKTYVRIREIKEAVKLLEDEQEALQDLILKTIPTGMTQDGFTHVLTPSSSVSYKSFADFIIDKFVPGTKKAQASAMISQFTKAGEKHSIKEVK